MRWLHYQHLYYFWTVAKLGSVTDAARELRLAQPTVSAQLKTFEEVIGHSLFKREGRRLVLTEVGHIAYRYAEQIFSLGQEFLGVLDGQPRAGKQNLRIGVADVVPKVVASRILQPALESPIRGTLTCVEDRAERLLAELSIAAVDLVISDSPIPPTVKVKAYNHFLGECGVVFLATKPYASRYRRKFPGSLQRAPVLLPTRGTALRRELDQWFASISVEPDCVAEFQDSALMKNVARMGNGILPAPEVVAKEIMQEFNLVRLGTVPTVKERFYLISPERRLSNPLISELVQHAQKRLFA